MSERDPHEAIRLEAFEYVRLESDKAGGVVARETLESFNFRGERMPLIEPPRGRGIRKPAGWRLPLSIRTDQEGPYNDQVTPEGELIYHYLGEDDENAYNRSMRKAMRRNVPLLYFVGAGTRRYLPIWPCFVIRDDRASRVFVVQADDPGYMLVQQEGVAAEARREYVTTEQRRRLHQAMFREQVLDAYAERCCVCRLGHRELLDAAHIIPDADAGGDPVVSNGLAMCKLHHAAYDRNILGIDPNYKIGLRRDLLTERDGPMLKHGMQGFEGSTIHVPGRQLWQPNRERLARRWEQFQQAS